MKNTSKMTKALFGGGLILLLVLTLVGQVEAQVCTPPPSGMISWWDGDSVSGTTAEDIQDGNDGTLMNGATTAPGKVGDAFSFDGVDDHIQLNIDSGVFTDQFTIDAWAFPTKLNLYAYAQGILNNDRWFNRGMGFGVVGGTPFWWGGVYYPNPLRVYGQFFNAGDTVFYLEAVTTPNEWHHYALTYDGSQLCLYQDGVQESCVSASGNVKDNNVNFRIGHDRHEEENNRQERFFGGKIDEVEIFNRALSAAETQDIFDAGSAGKCKGIEVALDVKPQSCPNPLNVKSKGKLPVAILSTPDFDVRMIDITSLRLNGIAPVRSAFEDVTTPTGLDPCDCLALSGDGSEDLILKFNTQAIIETLGGDVQNGDEIELTLTGVLMDGTAIEGSDCVVIKGIK